MIPVLWSTLMSWTRCCSAFILQKSLVARTSLSTPGRAWQSCSSSTTSSCWTGTGAMEGRGPGIQLYNRLYMYPIYNHPHRSEGPSGHHKDLQDWLKNLPSNYTAMLGMFTSLCSFLSIFLLNLLSSYHGLVPHPLIQDDWLQDPGWASYIKSIYHL